MQIEVKNVWKQKSVRDGNSGKKLLTIFFFYSILVFTVGLVIINLTPLNKIFYPESNYYKKEDQEKFVGLNRRLLFLSKEIEELKNNFGVSKISFSDCIFHPSSHMERVCDSIIKSKVEKVSFEIHKE